MYTTANTDTLQGRQLDGLLRSKNRKARMLVTVDITKAAGTKYHQVFRVKAWDGNNGRMLTLDLDDGDWAAGVHATKVLHVDTTAGTVRPARGMTDKALLYAAHAAVRWAFTGQAPQPRNGTVEVSAAELCGACGTELTHKDSKELGIGPECAKRMGVDHHYHGTTLTSRAKREAAKQAAPAPAPVQQVLGNPQDADAAGTDIFGAPVDRAAEREYQRQDELVQARMAAPGTDTVTPPCRLCWGQCKLKGYHCGYCDGTGNAQTMRLAGMDATTAAAIRSLCNAAWRMAKQMPLQQSEQDYVHLADRLDTCMGDLGGLYAEAHAAVVA